MHLGSTWSWIFWFFLFDHIVRKLFTFFICFSLAWLHFRLLFKISLRPIVLKKKPTTNSTNLQVVWQLVDALFRSAFWQQLLSTAVVLLLMQHVFFFCFPHPHHPPHPPLYPFHQVDLSFRKVTSKFSTWSASSSALGSTFRPILRRRRSSHYSGRHCSGSAPQLTPETPYASPNILSLHAIHPFAFPLIARFCFVFRLRR